MTIFAGNPISKISNYKRKMFYGFSILICVFLGLSIYIPILKYFTLILALAPAVLKRDNSFLALLFFIPFVYVFQTKEGTSLFFIIEVVYLTKLIVLSKKKKQLLICFLALGLFLLMSLNLLANVKLACKVFVSVSLLITFITENKGSIKSQHTFITFSIAVVFSSLLGILVRVFPSNNPSFEFTYFYSFFFRFSGLFPDPNIYALTICFCLPFLLLCFF